MQNEDGKFSLSNGGIENADPDIALLYTGGLNCGDGQ